MKIKCEQAYSAADTQQEVLPPATDFQSFDASSYNGSRPQVHIEWAMRCRKWHQLPRWYFPHKPV
jgi:hypothetical protein